jgi:hypothetical protein
MKTFLFSIAAISAFTAFTQQASAYQLETKLSPDPAITGKQTLIVHVKGDNGKTDSSAKISAKAVMPASPDMMEMVSNGKIEKEAAGKYSIKFNLSMGGTWLLNVDVGEGKKLQTFVFEVSTGKPSLKKVKP